MNYTLIMPGGRRMQFYIRSVAEMYQTVNGGYIIDHTEPRLRLVA